MSLTAFSSLEPSYLSVFPDNPPNTILPTLCIVALCGSILLLGIAGGLSMDKRMTGRRIGKPLIILMVVGLLAGGTSGTILYKSSANNSRLAQGQIEHMNANLKQKYGATLMAPNGFGYKKENLVSGDEKYWLSLADGKSGDYYIKWDEGTSEPTIIDKTPPTPQELNQSANKR